MTNQTNLKNANIDNQKEERFFELWLKPAIIAGLWITHRRLYRILGEYRANNIPQRLKLLNQAMDDIIYMNRDTGLLAWFLKTSIHTLTIFLMLDNAYNTRFNAFIRRYLILIKRNGLTP